MEVAVKRSGCKRTGGQRTRKASDTSRLISAANETKTVARRGKYSVDAHVIHPTLGRAAVRECTEHRSTNDGKVGQKSRGKREVLYWHTKEISIQMLGYAYDRQGTSRDHYGDSKARGESEGPSVCTANEQTSERD